MFHSGLNFTQTVDGIKRDEVEGFVLCYGSECVNNTLPYTRVISGRTDRYMNGSVDGYIQSHKISSKRLIAVKLHATEFRFLAVYNILKKK